MVARTHKFGSSVSSPDSGDMISARVISFFRGEPTLLPSSGVDAERPDRNDDSLQRWD